MTARAYAGGEVCPTSDWTGPGPRRRLIPGPRRVEDQDVVHARQQFRRRPAGRRHQQIHPVGGVANARIAGPVSSTSPSLSSRTASTRVDAATPAAVVPVAVAGAHAAAPPGVDPPRTAPSAATRSRRRRQVRRHQFRPVDLRRPGDRRRHQHPDRTGGVAALARRPRCRRSPRTGTAVRPARRGAPQNHARQRFPAGAAVFGHMRADLPDIERPQFPIDPLG